MKLNKRSQRVPDGYSLHVRFGGSNFHVFRHCSMDKRIWQAKRDGLVENAAYAYSYDDVELHEILVNSLFPWDEIPPLTKFLKKEMNLASDARIAPFPLPLPLSYTSLDFSSGGDDPIVINVCNSGEELPPQLCALLFDTVGIHDELWIENCLGEYFTARERFQIRSFNLDPAKDNFPFDFQLCGYEEPTNRCFLEYLRDCRVKTESFPASALREGNHA